ncbi:Kelch repeat-containing protein [Undibacterium crateris]|uniref:Kelch repeat-containing protein n=1 Tax=Undibacterium crateris TaxID=2528175 RepID=UPI0013894EBF|nr:kelch motif-containing protein [Undibacterium crateris]NDI84735.1 hypothetical protein [Undibacterium crateris]
MHSDQTYLTSLRLSRHCFLFLLLAALIFLSVLYPSNSLAVGRYDAKSTAECEMQVNAVPNPTPRWRQVALQNCKLIDQMRHNARMSLAYNRVSNALRSMKSGDPISDRAQREIYADQIIVRKYPPEPYLTAYKALFLEFVQKALRYDPTTAALASHWEESAARCELFNDTLQAIKSKHEEALLAALRARRSSDVTEKSKSNEYEALRQAYLQKLTIHKRSASALQCLYPDPVVESISETNTTGLIKRDVYVESEEDAPKGNMQSVGAYLWRSEGSSAKQLANRHILVYGAGLSSDYWEPNSFQLQKLKSHLVMGKFDQNRIDPLLWDPKQHGWHKLMAAPECPSNRRSLHTTTELPDGKVLIVGGVCSRDSGETTNAQLQSNIGLSLLDVSTRKWLKAPVTQQARVYHTANLMPNGGVIIIGGLDVSKADGTQTVLNSVELFSQGTLSILPPLLQARAKHSTTILPNGSVVVAGGFDLSGNPLDSVEIWNPTTSSWRLLAPMKTARFSHTASLLKNGQVIFAGGWSSAETPTSSVEILDLSLENWTPGPDLPITLHGHAATVLSTGAVVVVGGAWIASPDREIPWAWILDVNSNEWHAIGRAVIPKRDSLSTGLSLTENNQGGIDILSKNGIFRWRPNKDTSFKAIPNWRNYPSITKLADGKSMWIGLEFGNMGTTRPIAYLYDPISKTWSNAGRLNRGQWSNEASIELSSRQVMHLGITADVLQCEIWEPGTTIWTDCGAAQSEYVSHTPLELGLMPDGHVFAIANLHETFVFDAETKEWNVWHSEWNPNSLQFGVAMRVEAPLFSLYDEYTGKWIVDNNAGAHFWMRGTTSDGDRLLLDKKAGIWTYVLHGQKVIGKDAQFLPDGCALSTNPLSIFNPSTGKAELIEGSIAARIPKYGVLQVYDDGTFTVVKEMQHETDIGIAFFSGKASCSGITSIDLTNDQVFGGLIKDLATPVAITKSEERHFINVVREFWFQKVQPWFQQYLWIILIVLALTIIFVLSKKTDLGKVQIKSSLSFRIFIYTLVGLYVIANLSQRFSAPKKDIWFTCDLEIKACLDEKTGLLKSENQVPSSVPCNMVGTWTYRKYNVQRRITLKDDGSYSMKSVQGSAEDGKVYTGLWSKQGDTIAWRHEQGGTDIERNPIIFDDERQFTLTEFDGSKTHFELNQLSSSQHCSK